jgi:solute carrier family 27 fatty acid transporter 1/4
MVVELQINNDLYFRLPSYARPAFVRLVRELDVTGTYKLKKRDLQVPFYFTCFQ